METNTISELINKYEDKTKELFNEIKELEEKKQKNEESVNKINEVEKNSQKTEELFDKITEKEENKQIEDLYKQLMARNDTKEEYILSYLLFLKKTDEEKFNLILIEKQHYISEENYDKNFDGIIEDRKCARQKFLDLIELLANCSLDSIPEKSSIYLSLLILGKKEPKQKLKTKHEITRENKELYLINLYLFFLNAILKTLNKYNDDFVGTEEYFNTFFFNNYIISLHKFLRKVYNNFKVRFGDLKLENEEDQLLFEDFVEFISTYPFRQCDDKYCNIWNETFCPINKEEKNQICLNVNQVNKLKDKKDKTIIYNYKLDEIQITDNSNGKIYKINELDLYALESLCFDLFNSDDELFMNEWLKNKYLKPNNYNTCLFVSKKRNIWGDILFKIMNSESFRDAKKFIFKDIQIDFFIDRQLVDRILDNIRYITYPSKFYGETHANTLRIYEIGIFNINIDNRSISLLIYHSSNIVINIHEIGGHVNRKLQHFYNDNSSFAESPELLKKEKDKYSQNAKARKAETGETMEILLFGRVICSLTIKEALYILNIDYYKKNVFKFREDFCNCNNQDIKEILSDKNLQLVLENLDINKNELLKNMTSEKYPFTEGYKRKNQNEYQICGNVHSLAFYDNYNFLQDFYTYVRKNNIDDKDLINAFIKFGNYYNNKK